MRRRRDREARGRFLAEGVRVLEDLLSSNLEIHLMTHVSSLGDAERGRALLEEAFRRGVPTRVVSEGELRRLSDTESPQGVLAIASVPDWSLDDLSSRSEREVVLVLDAVQDPGNVGTLIRSAEALGARGVISTPGTADLWNPKVVRAAVGSSFRQPVVSATWDSLAEWLPAAGYEIVLSEVDGAPVAPVRRPVALVMGNEGAGVSDPARRVADRSIGIPLRGPAESLNVNAAAAILLYELLR